METFYHKIKYKAPAFVTPSYINRLAESFYNEWSKITGETVNFKDLSKVEQEENRTAAVVALSIIDDAINTGIIASDYFEDIAAEQIHQAWIARNSKHANSEDLKPFNKLTEKEKEKDRIQVQEAIKMYEELN